MHRHVYGLPLATYHLPSLRSSLRAETAADACSSSDALPVPALPVPALPVPALPPLAGGYQ